MRKNETMIGATTKVKIAVQSAYKESNKFIANVGLGMIDGTVCWFECVFTSSHPVTIATGRYSESIRNEIELLKQFIATNETAIRQFAESL